MEAKIQLNKKDNPNVCLLTDSRKKITDYAVRILLKEEKSLSIALYYSLVYLVTCDVQHPSSQLLWSSSWTL